MPSAMTDWTEWDKETHRHAWGGLPWEPRRKMALLSAIMD